jgi:hypothetical protein
VARNDISVKLDAQVTRKAKLVATNRGITLAEYLSELLKPLVARDYDAEFKQPNKPKGGSK